jgi:hypothetical protein
LFWFKKNIDPVTRSRLDNPVKTRNPGLGLGQVLKLCLKVLQKIDQLKKKINWKIRGKN